MPSNSFYPSIFSTEPSLRDELISFLDGKFPEVAKKQLALLRKMRRDSDGNLVECACVDEVTHEPDLDTFCPYCSGDKYYWDESYIDIYKVVISSDIGKAQKEITIPPTLMNVPNVIFYLKSSVDITEQDKIVELILDAEGKFNKPYKRKKIYRIGTLEDLRSDNGRLEYWKVACYSEERRFLNGPTG